ncbi:hypothetical protein PR048_012139 [Dryococelus australis]|uniref:Uncharacterized protein n=1 Tax=Dryococelus australis TaxID=614101 RepID=A0ABQ9HNL5_9NEOP|nr:hypothetical protein PR048_012139 [Dryococelus australis]
MGIATSMGKIANETWFEQWEQVLLRRAVRLCVLQKKSHRDRDVKKGLFQFKRRARTGSQISPSAKVTSDVPNTERPSEVVGDLVWRASTSSDPLASQPHVAEHLPKVGENCRYNCFVSSSYEKRLRASYIRKDQHDSATIASTGIPRNDFRHDVHCPVTHLQNYQWRSQKFLRRVGQIGWTRMWIPNREGWATNCGETLLPGAIFLLLEKETRRSYKGYTVRPIKFNIAAKYKALDRRAVFSSLSYAYGIAKDGKWSGVELQRAVVNGRSPRKPAQQRALSGTIPTGENPGQTLPRIEPNSPWWEANAQALPLATPGRHERPATAIDQLIRSPGGNLAAAAHGQVLLITFAAASRDLARLLGNCRPVGVECAWPRNGRGRAGVREEWTSIGCNYRDIHRRHRGTRPARLLVAVPSVPASAFIKAPVYRKLLSMFQSQKQAAHLAPRRSCKPYICIWLDYSPHTIAHWVRFLAGFACGNRAGPFVRGSPVSPALAFRRCSILTSRDPHRLLRPPLKALLMICLCAYCLAKANSAAEICTNVTSSQEPFAAQDHV